MNNIVTSKFAAPVLFAGETAPLRRFTVDEYHAMGTAGVLEDDRVELLDGLIVMMSPIGPSHAYSAEHIGDILRPLLPADWHLRTQQPITLPTSEPQPDLAIVFGKRRDYLHRHPAPQDIILLIEVADSTLDLDRQKAGLYAAAGISEFWIINLVHPQVEVYRDPGQPKDLGVITYRAQRIVKEGAKLPIALAGKKLGTVLVRNLLP